MARAVFCVHDGGRLGVNEALALRERGGEYQFSCESCGKPLRAHKAGTTGQVAHFEHLERNPSCRLSDPLVEPSSPAVIMAQGREFTFQRASDVVRDGMGLELVELPSRDVVAEVFFRDPSGPFSITFFRRELPLEAVERLIARAKRTLVPIKTNKP